MSQRIQPFFKYDAKSCTLFLWIWRKELNPFLWIWRKEMNTFFFHLTHRIEPCVKKETQRMELLIKDSNNWTVRQKKKDSENGTLKKNKNIKLFFFQIMTPWIEFSWAWVKELNFWCFSKKNTRRIELFSKIRHKELNFFFFNMTRFFQYDSKNLTLHFTMTQRLCFFQKKKKLKEFDFYDSQTWTFFLFFFSKNDSKNWSLFLNYDSQNGFFFFEIRIRPTEILFSIRLTELNLFDMTQELNLVLNMIERIVFEFRLKELNLFFWLKELNLLLMRRNALNFFLVCRKELSLILNMAQRIELIFLI